ncbi:hypothetical protein C5167_028975 [Papaver somniferum]|nr:hypothetical protein C5167_028975 [Papaver somniferum]
MARIIKKSAASITPILLAYTRTACRNYSSSSIFIAPKWKNSSTNIRSLIYLIRIPTRDFSSSSIDNKKGPSGSDKIICAAEHLIKKGPTKTDNLNITSLYSTVF